MAMNSKETYISLYIFIKRYYIFVYGLLNKYTLPVNIRHYFCAFSIKVFMINVYAL
jgi:hypothetical protein